MFHNSTPDDTAKFPEAPLGATDPHQSQSPQESPSGADNPHYPEEFQPFCQDPSSITCRTARLFGVAPETVTHWRWHMKRQVSRAQDLKGALDLGHEESAGFEGLSHLFQTGITPYYLSLMNPDPAKNCPIRLQALPRIDELYDPLGQKDPLDEVPHSPVKEVVQVYPDRVAFCVAQLCPVYCRYCFRKRRDDEEGLHYNRKIVDQGIKYIASNPAIRDVLVTGGDPFIASDDAIVSLAARLREIPHVDIIRFGTRTPVTLPYRITKELARRLSAYHPIFVNTHFNCAEEVTPEAVAAVSHLVNHGFPVGNQAVLLKGVNNHPEAMLALSRALLKARVRPYYLFHPHLVEGTAHLRVSVNEGLKIMRYMRGKITGLGIPTYIIDTPAGKVPITPQHILGEDGDDLLLEDKYGQIWREKGVLAP